MKDIDKYRGCIIGGAVGDALGFPVEFMQAEAIFRKYGESGITEYEPFNGVARISDDTQMTLFTANGLLLGTTRGMMRGIMGSYGFAQNLANKLGRKVVAPSDTVWIHPSGKMTIGPNAWSDTGKWISYYPKK